ncbi:MAG: class I SAM-dependent methyltransferase [bacterium]|nr:class I SAM-dependent methyltransferase [bacterium]
MLKKFNIGHIDKCQICSNNNLKTILTFGHQPIVQSYLTEKQLHEAEATYPLNFCFCPACGLAQLDYIPDPKLVFPKNYPYRTGLTDMLIRNFRELADTLEKKYQLKNTDLIIDIGCNDGTLLQGFKDKGMRVLGIEPTDAAKDARRKGIPAIQEYFNEKIARLAAKKYGRAKIITLTNVFAHINNVHEIMRGVKVLLGDGGIFVTESQYMLSMMRELELDTIYHEHLRFYSLKPLKKLFSLTGFTLVDAEKISAAGGSIRVYAQKGKHAVSARVEKQISAEEKAGLYDIEALRRYGQKMIGAKNKLMALLIKCKREKTAIAGIGSPGRSNTLLNFVKINDQLLDYTCEKTGSPKIGLFTPGMHIPVVDEKRLLRDQPDYALVLSWHIGEELMKKLRRLGYKGKFIMPLPEPRIIK